MKYFLLFLLTLFCALASNAQYAVATGDGGYRLNPVPFLSSPSFIDAQDVLFEKREDGTLNMYILNDEVLSELGVKLVLRPRGVGEKVSSGFHFPLSLSEDLTRYTFLETSLFSIGQDGRLLFQGKPVRDFELVMPVRSSDGL